MPTAEEEAKWRAEFEAAGETEIRDGLKLIQHEPKRQFAFRWLREQATARKRRETQLHWYARWTFWAAVAAVLVGIIGVIVGIIGVAVTWFWH
ncbi:MAG: hypothetical protein WAV78_15645 [Xanthobacteraceae bacterium]|jgi:hypothetical protein